MFVRGVRRVFSMWTELGLLTPNSTRRHEHFLKSTYDMELITLIQNITTMIWVSS